MTVYFALLTFGSAFFEWKIVKIGEPIEKIPALIFALMYVPAIASIGARLVLREGFGDVSFRLGGQEGRRSLLLALLYPVVVGFADVEDAQRRHQPGGARRPAQQHGELLHDVRVPRCRHGDHVVDAFPNLVEQILA